MILRAFTQKMKKEVHSARFELARVSPADLESAALDRSATNALFEVFKINLAYNTLPQDKISLVSSRQS